MILEIYKQCRLQKHSGVNYGEKYCRVVPWQLELIIVWHLESELL